MRTPIRVRQGKALEKSLERVLMGLHYRHEFARRRDDISNASKDLLGRLSIPLERAKTFEAEADGSPFSEDIFHAIRRVSPPKARMLKEHLRTFLHRWSVFPMAPGDKPFFPHPKKIPRDQAADRVRPFRIWAGVMKFEVFAIARLQLGRPIMVPVMLISEEESPTGVKFHEQLDLSEYKHPSIVNLEMPNEVISAYVEAFRLLERITPRRSEEVPSDDAVAKIPWDTFDRVLATFDRRQRQGGSKSEMEELYKSYSRAKSAKRENPLLDTFRTQYYRWSKSAKFWIAHYKDII